MRAWRASAVVLLVLAVAPDARAQYWNGGQAAVSPDGRNLYVTGLRTMSYARDPATGALTQISDLEAGGESLAVSADGRSVYVGGPTWIAAYQRDPGSGLLTHVQTLHSPDAGEGARNALVIAPDGRSVYAVPQNGAQGFVVLARDPETSRLTRIGLHPLPGVTGIAISADGAHLYAPSSDGLRHLVRRADGSLTESGERRYVNGSALALIGSHLVVATQSHGTSILPVDPQSGDLGEPKPTWETPKECGIDACQFAQAGYLAATPDGVLHVADGHSAIVTSRIAGGELRRERADTDGAAGISELRRPYSLALAPDGSSLYAVSYVDWLRSAIVTFERDAAGVLAFAGAFRPAPRGFENDRGLPKQERMVVAGGARYVNERTVEVHTQPPAQLLKGLSTVSSLRISVDAVPGPFLRLAPDSRYAVELGAAGGEHRIGVEYTRPPWDFGLPLTWDGSVVLDQRRPRVTRARLARTRRGYALRLRARDDRSGLARMQLAARRSAPRRAVRYRRVARVARPRAVRWLRVRDRAGNLSAWRRVQGPGGR